MKFKSCFSYVLLFLVSCGGGSNGPTSAIEGEWRGDLLQGVISCSDGTFIGAGGGSTLRQLTLEITGADELGTVVQVADGDCLLEGQRTAKGFIAYPIGGCEQELLSIHFNIVSENEASVNYKYDINKSLPNQDGVRCSISPSASVSR